MLVDYFSKKSDLQVTATVRSEEIVRELSVQLPNVNWKVFDANSPDLDKALDVIKGNQWAINAIGIIKPLIHDENPLRLRGLSELILYCHICWQKS